MVSAEHVHKLLTLTTQGRREALDEMLPIVYGELHRLARGYLRREGSAVTLQPTMLVNEAYLKLIGQRNVDFHNRAQFVGVAAMVMRRFLIDRAKSKKAQMHGGGAVHVELDEARDGGYAPDIDLLALNLALESLAAMNPDAARLVELRYFGGATIEESASVLGWTTIRVNRCLRFAKAFLYATMTGAPVSERSNDAADVH